MADATYTNGVGKVFMGTNGTWQAIGYVDKELYKSNYWISADGSVYHEATKLKPVVNSHGYHFYTIYLPDGKQKSILPHVEVWRNFKGEYPIGGIKHKDGNKLNNNVDNLIACHPVEDYMRHLINGVSITKIAKHYGTTKKDISKYVAMRHPGGVRAIRKFYPLNRSLDIQ